jgi:uncharacterized protein YjbJ (UPF0337 family)
LGLLPSGQLLLGVANKGTEFVEFRPTVHEVKGAIKHEAGELTKNPNLEADGNAERNAGKVQHFVGKIEKAIGE